MKRDIPYSSLFLLRFLVFMCSGCRQKEATSDFVPEYEGIFNAPSKVVPTLFTTDGAVAGNGSVTGSGQEDNIYWASRKFESTDLEWPKMAGNMQRSCLTAGEFISLWG